MRRLVRSALAAAVALAALAAACGDNQAPSMPPGDGGVDGGPEPLAACLDRPPDRPTELPRPPSGQLPCELLPPGFGAPP